MTRAQAITCIEGLDTALGIARGFWLVERDPAKKAEYKRKLDGLLDERLTHMAIRDAQLTLAVPADPVAPASITVGADLPKSPKRRRVPRGPVSP